MPDRSLPQYPHLGQLRRQAKDLLNAARAGDPDAVGRMREQIPIRTATRLSLAAAQLVVAREYGFASWPRLKAEIEVSAMDLAQRVDAFLAASVENRPDRAARLLAGGHRIATFDISTAAVLGEASYLGELLERHPAMAVAPDRRRGWPPLLYVCHSPWHLIDPARADGMLQVARLLLDAGASPDTHNGLPARYGYRSALFGAAGIANNPSITRLLLDRGADPDDDESLYHAAYHAPDHACLRLLLEHGATVNGTNALYAMLDTGDAEGVRVLLEAGAYAVPPHIDETDRGSQYADSFPHPVPLAFEKGCSSDVIGALLAAGADPNAAGPDGTSALRAAVRRGMPDAADLLRNYGARDDTINADHFLGACSRADRLGAERWLSHRPNLLDELTEEDRALLVDAAAHAEVPAVRLMLDLGFPPDVHRRTDGNTPLHEAAFEGRAELVRLLLSRGANIDSHDAEFGSTPLTFATVGSGEHSRGDSVATVSLLLDAGASTDNAWIPGKPPSEDVAALLIAHGLGPDDEPQLGGQGDRPRAGRDQETRGES